MQSLFINNKEKEIPEYCSIYGEPLEPDEIDICSNYVYCHITTLLIFLLFFILEFDLSLYQRKKGIKRTPEGGHRIPPIIHTIGELSGESLITN